VLAYGICPLTALALFLLPPRKIKQLFIRYVKFISNYTFWPIAKMGYDSITFNMPTLFCVRINFQLVYAISLRLLPQLTSVNHNMVLNDFVLTKPIGRLTSIGHWQIGNIRVLGIETLYNVLHVFWQWYKIITLFPNCLWFHHPGKVFPKVSFKAPFMTKPSRRP